MAMGQQKDRQGDLMVSWSEMPRSPGHVFYDRLQLVLIEGGFDGFAEAVCQPWDWVSRSDPEAKIAKMKDGTTHLAYKPEHAVDLDTGAVVAAELHPADEGDTTTLPKTLAAAEANLEAVDVAPTAEDPAECVTDKGYHSRLVLKALDDGPWKSRISEPKQKGFARWHGDDAARRAVTNNRTRLLSGVAREAFKLRAEIVERSFAHNLDRGGMRRTWLRGRENVHKRYLLHVAGHNLSLLMRQLIGAGTPKEAVAGGIGALFVLVTPAGAVLVVQIVLIPDFSPKNSVESDYLLQTNSYRNFREATKIQGVFPFRAVFRPAAGGFARFRRAIARRPVSPSSFPCFATHR